jgi:streptogramin lyase
MNAQVKPPARQRTAELPHRNLISRLRARPARVLGGLIVPVMLAVLALSAPAAMADPLGQITEFSVGLNPGSSPGFQDPESIAAGPDGNLWFTDHGATPAIGRITPSGRSPSSPPA